MKDYFYRGYKYFYSRKYKKWVVCLEEEYTYCDTEQDARELIDFILRRF